jgi:DNA adenine methylase
MTKAINSPFRYAGGKFYARKLILEFIPPHTDYVEPFAGGASIFFAKNKVKNNWLNDIDGELINVFLFIRDNPEQLITALKGEVATKERHHFYKYHFIPENPLEKAVRWYYLNRTSFSGIMNMKHCYWGYSHKSSMPPEKWAISILQTSQKLQNVCLSKLDFEEVIERVPDRAFLFLDPPYFKTQQDKIYSCAFTHKCHHRLCKALKRAGNRFQFLLTYDNCCEIREMYAWAKLIVEKQWNYTIQRTDNQKLTKTKTINDTQIQEISKLKLKGRRSQGRELFITNYNPHSYF